MEQAEQQQKKIILTIPFDDNLHTLLTSDVLNVDKELRGSGIQREITVKEKELVVTFKGADYKKLRVSINALLKNVILIVQTISRFNR